MDNPVYPPDPPTGPPSYQVISPLKYNTSVYWRVLACNSSNTCSLWSAVRKLVAAPGKPTHLFRLYQSQDNTFMWTDPGTYPNSANSYSVAIYNNLTCTATPWKTISTTTPSTHLALSNGTSYCVKVRGVGPSASITGPYSDPLSFVTAQPPATPVLSGPADKAIISASVGGASPYQVDFSWKASPPPLPGDSVEYELQVSSSSDFSDLFLSDIHLSSPLITHYFFAGKWYWRVRSNVTGAYSLWSPVRSFTTPGQISGYVTGAHVGALANVTVTLSGVSGSTTTNASGNYYFAGIPAGTHTLTLTKTGFVTQTRTVTVANAVHLSEPFMLLDPTDVPGGVLRIVLTWNPDGGRILDGNLWLPPASPFHLVYPTIGKADLDAFPHGLVGRGDPSNGLETIDIKPVAGNYVFAVNQLTPASASWSGAGAKVEVYSGGATLTLLRTCLQPSGSGRWWYAFDLNGSSVTCKNSLRTAAPAPYPDAAPITGHVYAKDTLHPLGGVWINYSIGAEITKIGSVMTDQNGFYTVSGLAPGSYTLTPLGEGLQSFSPPSASVAPATNGADFTGTVDSNWSPGSLRTEAIQGDYAYIGASQGWLYIINIHDKAHPAEVSRLWIDQADIQSIVVSGAYAYLVSNWEGGAEVDVVDVSDPAHPKWLSSAPVEAKDAFNLAVYGQYLLVSSSRYLYIYQQSDTPTPHLLNRLVTLDLTGDWAVAWVAVSGHYAYVPGSQGLYIYDITNPAKPSKPWVYPAFAWYFNLVVDGQYAYLGSDDGDVLILNVADPAHVYQVSQTTMESSRLEKAGNFLFAITPSSEKQMLILDVSDPAHPAMELGSTPFTYTTWDVKVQENYAFVIDGATGLSAPSHLSILDVTNKASPHLVGSYMPAP